MAVCVENVGFYAFPGPTGTARIYISGFSVSDPQPDDKTTCSLVVVDGLEYRLISASPFALTAEQGAQVGVAILTLWAVAWGFRQLGQFLKQTSSHSGD